MERKNEEADEVQQVEKEEEKAVLEADFVNSAVSGDLAGMVEKSCGVERSSSDVLAGESFQHTGQSWD